MLIHCSLLSCLSYPHSPESEVRGGGGNVGRVWRQERVWEKVSLQAPLSRGPIVAKSLPLPVTDFSSLTLTTTKNSYYPIAKMRKLRLGEKYLAPG